MPPKPKAAAGRRPSEVHAIDASGQAFKNFQIWTAKAPAVIEDPDLCYAKCVVLPGSTKTLFKCKQVEPVDQENREFEVPPTAAFNCNSSIDPMKFSDLGMIPHTNDAAALDFLKQRYVKGQIYTEAKPLLVAINPFKDVGNATQEWIVKYRDIKDVEKLGPHVFTIARVALENLHGVKKSQTIIVSGESGAGKTEATKQIMRYFAAAQSGTADTRIQSAVLAANPVLEAFGNAKTIRNNNSSRFGRFMILQVAKGGGIEYGTVRNFLLEKSRLVSQSRDERNYHVFYQMIKGATPEQKIKFKLQQFSDYKFINPHCLDAPGIDDVEEWHDVEKSMVQIQMTPEETDSIYSMLSGVMLYGNVQISAAPRQGIPEAAALDDKNRAILVDACNLCFLDPKLVEECLLVKIQKAGGQEIKGVWKQDEALTLKESLGKAIYDKLFDWVVRKVNKMIEPPRGFSHFMAMLDIFGFEVFQNNSLEQLFINCTNEMLQKNFIDAVFEKECKLYREEGISAADLVWTTNQEIIDVLTKKGSSMMSALEDQCLTNGNDEKFVASCHTMLKNSPKLIKAKVNPNICFLIAHTIGQISYNAAGFLLKNKDVLRAELVEVIQASPNPVSAGIFEGVVVEKGKLAKGQLIGSQFMGQLTELMTLINATEPHFIRCVKPNECKTPLKWTAGRVIVQLMALSILEALQLKNLGYAYRRPFTEFLLQFRFINMGIASDTSSDPKVAAEKLIKSAQIKDGFQMGKTMVFLKTDTVKLMVVKQREALAAWTPVVDVVEAMIIKRKYKKLHSAHVSAIIRVQARCRQKLNGKIAAPAHSVNLSGWR